MRFIILLFLCTSGFAKNFDYNINDKVYEGFVLDKGKNAPVVFIVHDWDGIDKYEQKRAQMLYDLGYSVFAIDMFGKGIRPQEVKAKQKITGDLYKNRKKMRMLMNTAFNEAKKLGLNTGNAMSIGYCFGGTSILEWAKSGVKLKGFASFHGNLGAKEGESYKDAKAKIAVYHGTADKIVSMQDFADLAALLEKENIEHEMITYSGAPHAFTKFGTDRYREKADKKSWNHLKDFLKEQSKI